MANPPKYLETYATVAERLAAFWIDHPLGMVLPGPAEFPDDKTVRIRAVVYRYDEPNHTHRMISSGQAEEIREGYINEAACVENCETSAVGRALALAGYGIDKGVASAEEIELAERRRRARNGSAEPEDAAVESAMTETKTPTEAANLDDELVKQIVTYVGDPSENPDESATRKELVKAKLMSLGVDNPIGVRESVVLLSQVNKAMLKEWLTNA